MPLKRLLQPLLLLNGLSLFGLLVLATLVFTWQLDRFSYDRGLARLHAAGESRLLFHISGIRRNLNRTRTMPYALAQNAEVIRLLEQDDAALRPTVERFLEQINQVAGSRRWEVLDRQARVVASSDWRDRPPGRTEFYQGALFFEQALQGERGGYFEARGANGLPVYLLSAPIYGAGGLIGVGLVTLDLGRLEESWTATDEALLVSDAEQLVFLTNRDGWRYQRLPLAGRRVRLGPSAADELRGVAGELGDGTRVVTLENPAGPAFLMQSVRLDDLGWQVHFLADLRPLLRQQRALLLFCLGGGLAAGLLLLLLRERLLKRRLHAEADALRLRNEAQQRAIIGGTQVGLITLDQAGRVRAVNPAAMAQFGVRAELLSGRSLGELLDPAPGPESLRRFPAQLREGQSPPAVRALEGGIRRGDGSCFPALLSINPLSWEDGDGYLVTIVDISRRKRAEQALQQANDALEQRVAERTEALHRAQRELIQQSKLAALGTLSAAIAHELNQPLTAIQTSVYSGRLLLQRAEPDGVRNQLDRIAAMAERMALISGQLKVFAHRRTAPCGAVGADAALDQVLGLLAPRIEQQGVRLRRQRRPTLQFYGDQPRIEQVLINLLGNALDALQGQADPALTLTLEADAEQGCIRVCDNGPGLSAAVLEQLFDPFFTTKEVGEGLGLGLAISYGILRDLEGRIDAENRPEGGACFSLWLPLFGGREQDRPAQSDQQGNPQGNPQGNQQPHPQSSNQEQGRGDDGQQ